MHSTATDQPSANASQPQPRRLVGTALALAFAFGLLFSPAAHAQEGRVEMEIGTEDGFNQLDIREWYQLLTDLKVSNLRIAGARAGDKIEIETEGSERSPIYRVNARLTANGELIVPGGRFSMRTRDALAKWIGDLRKYGPGGPKVDTRGSTFGLDDDQLKAIQKDLAKSVNFSTAGMSRTEIVDKLAERLDYEIALSNAGRQSLDSAGTASFELQGMACGTALAYVVRAAGLGMAPKQSQGSFEYQLASADSLKQQWPIGLKSDKRLQELIPNAFEIVDFQVNAQTPLNAALPPIAEHLKTSFLFDENALAAAEIDPSTTTVEMAPIRISLPIAATRLIGKAKLRSEVRIDEAGRAFYWITPLFIPKTP